MLNNDKNVVMMHPSSVLVDTSEGKVRSDLQSYMLQYCFQVSLYGQVNSEMSFHAVQQLLFLQEQDPKREVKVIINSPGGNVIDGKSIVDMMQLIENPISTICVGQASSMGAYILAAGDKGRRFALNGSSIMIHQPLGGFNGQASDIQIANDNIQKVKLELNENLSRFTGQPLKVIAKDTDRDFFMDAKQAKEYGIIDHVPYSMSELALESI